MLYSAIGSETVPDSFHFDSIAKIPQYRIKTDLLPVLRRGEHFERAAVLRTPPLPLPKATGSLAVLFPPVTAFSFPEAPKFSD